MSEKSQANVLVGTSIGAGKEYCLPFLLPVLRAMTGVGAVHIVFDEAEPSAEFLADLREGETYEVLPKLRGDFGYGARCGRVREKLREKFRAGKFAQMYFHDADMVPPLDIIPRLQAHNLSVATGLYSMRGAKQVAIPGSASYDGLDSPLQRFRENSNLLPCIHFGMGCMLLNAVALDVAFRSPAWLTSEGISEDIAWGRDYCQRKAPPVIGLDMSLSCWHIDSDGTASRIVVGEPVPSAIWEGQPHFISNCFGNWERGMPRPISRERAEQMSAEFQIGDFPTLTLEFAPVTEILPKGAN